MPSSISHAQSPAGRPDFLAQFQRMNPDLMEGRGTNRCESLWDLLTSRHREDDKCCFRAREAPDLHSCFRDHSELWRDKVTGLPVVVAHPYCPHRRSDDHHGPHREYLAERGLSYLVSTGSWYSDRTRLVVIARVDVLDRIELPEDENASDVLYRPYFDHVDWEMREALKLAEEGVVRNRLARLAPEAEEEGDLLTALRFYCDTAYVDRTGGFHKLAREQLDHAKRVLTAHPGLDRYFLGFKNDKDRDYVLGPVQPLLSRSSLERRLRGLELPPEWGRFIARDRGYAKAPIYSPGGEGEVAISQGGNMNKWCATVEIIGGRSLSTYAGTGPERSTYSPLNYCCEDPESAVEAAIDIWRRYEILAGQDR